MTCKGAIGGEIEVSLGMLRDAGGASDGVWPSLGQSYGVRCDTGRSALKLALRDWMARHTGAAPCVWVPSYICPSVCEAVSQLGLKIERYVDRPMPNSWRPPTPGPIDVVLVVHYFGLLNQDALRWLQGQEGRSWGAVEDCVQAPYSAGAGKAGDYAITSLRKWWAAPDGALVRARWPVAADALLPPDEGYVGRRAFAKLARGHHVDEATYLDWIEQSEERLECSAPRAVSWLSERLLGAANLAQATHARRGNWLALEDGLRARSSVRPLFGNLPDGAVPLAFPLLVAEGRRDALRRFLASQRIYCPVHWPLPALGNAEADVALSRQILSLPLDQRYGVTDMQSVIGCINEFFSKG